MSTVREHLGLLWLMRRSLATQNPQYDRQWEMQAALMVGAHLDELIALAGGADIEGWVRNKAAEIPSDFPHSVGQSPAPVTAEPVATVRDGLQGVWAEMTEEAADRLPEGTKLYAALVSHSAPADRDAIHDQALEKAASAVQSMGHVHPPMSYGQVCAETIRALKTHPSASPTGEMSQEGGEA